ncbi:putative ankyrin repeat domain-containing protein 19 isoform X6 [Peromyscus eremicus]|uniref:putative ankyrin repeat domain-containing protein 19 isoform X6 n=1 Tax=Peromyscus eremicus TaxID=42410 RepID=UPI0027DB8A82|nr:putative ankyrin repeat domain-containing protein 19 isoform X6 [Peromyscus eremicus]
MFSTLRKLFCFKKEPKTPLGFCDGPSSGKGSLSCCDCGTEDRYQPPYDPDNKFHEAVCQGRIKTVLKLLSKKFDVNDKDKRGRTALHFACFYGHLHLVYFLLHNECDVNELDDQKSTPLMKAVQSWETKIVSVLLDNEANPNIKDSKGETALHHAVYVDRPDIVTILLKFGGNIEETTKDGFTPLLLALRERKLLMSEHLIAHGANVYACDAFLRTTLMYAVKWDSEDIVEILLKKDVDYSLKDIFGWNALQYAMAGKRKVKSIILEYEDSLFSSQHSVFVGKQLGDISQSGHYLKSESLISVCSRTGEANFETQDASRKAAHSSNIGNDTEKNEINQDLYEELKEEIPKSKLKNERSFDKNAENQEFSVSDANGQQEASMEALCSSNMNDEAEENVIRHLEKKTVMEDQKQTSGEEQKQHSGGKTKRSFDKPATIACHLL